MNKVGYVISLVGGVLAILFSALLIITGPIIFAGEDIADFTTDNNQDLGKMWLYLGEHNHIDGFMQSNFDDYVDDYVDILQKTDARELEDISEASNVQAFAQLSGIAQDFEEYVPKLMVGAIACMIASVIALVGTQVARTYRITGGSMVLGSAALTLIFSLYASSIVPMAAASLLLILGGILQIVKQKQLQEKNTQEEAVS